MRRREFVTLFCGVAVGWPLMARAQPADQTRLVGVLMGYSESDSAAQSLLAAFRERLEKLNSAAGRNLHLEVHWGSGNSNQIALFAKELVSLRPDAILGETTSVVRSLARETQTIPIVFVQVSDPMASGFTTSLARPSGNITGFTVENAAQGANGSSY